jgi:NAD(P)-dependent dehydrogenase (short-subunit alcohol dehydrogenase family)
MHSIRVASMLASKAVARSVVITGCSSGFGELMAKTLAASSYRVFATMRDVQSRNAPAARALRDWAAQREAQLELLELDVTSDTSVEQAVNEVVRRACGIDVLVNNAGIAATGPLEAFSMAQVETLFGLNALGPLRVSKAILPTMRAQQSGLIVFVTSTLGRVLPRRGGLYASTKWALEGLAESLHYEAARFGIDVAILEPGSFPTQAVAKGTSAERQDIVEAYAVAAPTQAPPQPTERGPRELPNPQDVADAVKKLIETPPRERPLRTVVGPVFTEGVAEYNSTYERVRDHLSEVLRRPDQAITWTKRPNS